MAEVNFNELFGNFSAADALAATETKKNSSYSSEGLYKPSYKDEKCTDQNYTALVRFIPFYHDGKWRTTVSRWECFLKDVNGENGIFVVSPKTDGKKCPIRNLSWKLYNSESAIDKDNSKKINVYQQYYALVEIVSDKQHPELVGKILIYQFGQKIADKLEAVMKSSDYQEGSNPFDLYEGRLFEINITKDATKKVNGNPVSNVDACRFIEKTAPIHFGEGLTLTRDRDSQKAFFEWLHKDAPKIQDYFWKEWDAETTEKVNANLASYTSNYVAPRSTVAAVQEAVAAATAPAAAQPAPAPVIEDMPDFTGEDAAPAQEIPTEETSVSAEDDEWIKNILNNS